MVEFVDVSKKYDGDLECIFEHFNLHIRRGEIVALTGESGIGKTTLINLLLKDIEPSSGQILVDGKRLSDIKSGELPYYRRELGVIFQDFRLIPNLSAYENVKAAMIGIGGWNRLSGTKKISLVFSMLGIQHLHNKKPNEMSGGEQQKVCMARAIINHPKILLADEPTGNLDPKASAEIFSLLRIINNQGITVIVSTHDLERLKDTDFRQIELNADNGFKNQRDKKGGINYE